MKWLTIDWIKQHSRICADGEEELLELYGNDAEQTVLNLIRRDYTDLLETYGEVPAPLYMAALMLVEVDYNYRSPDAMNNLYQVKYGFDQKIKPYMRLAGSGSSGLTNNSNNNYGCKNL